MAIAQQKFVVTPLAENKVAELPTGPLFWRIENFAALAPQDQSQHRLRRSERRGEGVSDKIWLVSFMDYDLGFFDHETDRLGSAENPFAAKC